MAAKLTAAQKKAAELRAQADTLDGETTTEDSQVAERQSSVMNWFKSFIPDFSFGGLLEMVLIFTGIYFFARSDMGQNLIHGIVDNLDPDTKFNVLGFLNKIGIEIDMGPELTGMNQEARHKKLSENGVSDDVLAIIDPKGNTETFPKLLDMIKRANGGKVTPSGFTSPETIAALIQENPAMAFDLVNTVMKPSADGKPSELADSLNESLKAIINNKKLFAKLLNTDNQANTIKLLTAALPADAPIRAQGLADVIAKGIDANGPTDALRQLFTNAIDGKKDAVISGAYSLVGPAGFVDLIDATKLTNEAAKYAVETVQSNPKAKAAYVALVNAIGDDKAKELLTAFQSADAGTQIPALLLNKDNMKALPQALALLEQLPALASKLPQAQADMLNTARKFLTPEGASVVKELAEKGIDPIAFSANFLGADHKFSMDRSVDALLNPEVRAQLKQLGTDKVAKLIEGENPLMNAHNLDAFVHFSDALNKDNAANQPVMHAIAGLMTDMPVADVLKDLNGTQVSSFLKDNKAAIKTLLDEKNGIVGNTVALRNELAFLRTNFDVAPGVGLGAIAIVPDSADFVIKNAVGGDSMLSNDWTKRSGMLAFGGAALNQWGYSENREILLKLGKVIKENTTTEAVAANTPPSTDRATQTRG